MLRALGYRFVADAADIDESQRGLAPEAFVRQLAIEKARAVANRQHLPTLGADTIVVAGDRILGKPADADDAASMLRLLSDGWHEVLTGVALVQGDAESIVVTATRIRMSPWRAQDIAAYVATGDPMDKAGAYAIQGPAGAWVERVEGSYTGVVGLPLAETRALLAAASIEPAVSQTQNAA